MKSTTLSVVVLLLGIPSFAGGEECNSLDARMVEILDQYSIETGTKFVIDPRVRAKVTLIGLDTTNLGIATIRAILSIHGFTALTANDIVYVIPEHAAGQPGQQYGVPWED
jgi:hypothetical protein